MHSTATGGTARFTAAGTDPTATTRPEARSRRSMVASSHRLVSEVGARVLADGGRAGDAALAMAAVSFVTLPAMCGVGGDAFCV